MVSNLFLLGLALASFEMTIQRTTTALPSTGDVLDVSRWNGSVPLLLRGWEYMGGGGFQTPNGEVTVVRFDLAKNKIVAITRPLRKDPAGGILAIELLHVLPVFPSEGEKIATLCFHGNRVIPLGYMRAGRISRVVDTDGIRLREIKYPEADAYRCEVHHD